jgi:uncharacterized Zn-binding protein involved in type VI secretion
MEHYSVSKKNETMPFARTGDHHAKQDKPSSERQILHVFPHM